LKTWASFECYAYCNPGGEGRSFSRYKQKAEEGPSACCVTPRREFWGDECFPMHYLCGSLLQKHQNRNIAARFHSANQLLPMQSVPSHLRTMKAPQTTCAVSPHHSRKARIKSTYLPIFHCYHAFQTYPYRGLNH